MRRVTQGHLAVADRVALFDGTSGKLLKAVEKEITRQLPKLSRRAFIEKALAAKDPSLLEALAGGPTGAILWLFRLPYAAGSDENLLLTPPIRFDLEQALEFIGDDELVEVTPTAIRLRKRLLKEHERKRDQRKDD